MDRDTLRIAFWGDFSKRAINECKRCDHYYDMVLDRGKMISGNYCLHWQDLRFLWIKDYMVKRARHCEYYRNRKDDNPFNHIRENKLWYDLSL